MEQEYGNLEGWVPLEGVEWGLSHQPYLYEKIRPMEKEKKKKDNKAMTQNHLHLSNDILQDVLKEKSIVALWLKLE